LLSFCGALWPSSSESWSPPMSLETTKNATQEIWQWCTRRCQGQTT
jgi:hypothetical protein